MAPHADPQNEVEAVTDTTGVTIPDPLSAPLQINQIYGRRKKALKSQWGIAAPSTSDQFKSVSLKSKPKSKRWDSKLPSHRQVVIHSLPHCLRFMTILSFLSASQVFDMSCDHKSMAPWDGGSQHYV